MKVHLEGQPVAMELDMGSTMPVMSEGVYQEHLRHIPIKDTPLKLCTYMGGQLKLMGFCNITVQYKGQRKELPINIMKNEKPTLFCREWLASIQLNWPLLQ